MNLGLDANLDVGVGVDASELKKIVNLPDYDKFKANVGAKGEFKAFTILKRNYLRTYARTLYMVSTNLGDIAAALAPPTL